MMRGHPVFYVTGGSLRADAPCYVERQADREIVERLRKGELCYVLTPRQMGKSSLKVRAATRLADHGISVAVLDLTALGRNLTPEQWYLGMLDHLAEQIGLTREADEFWRHGSGHSPVMRFIHALMELANLVPGPSPPGLVVFVDEIDVVLSLPFATDEFFTAIRELYNRRTTDLAAGHVTFCLLGAAAPSDLISDARITPFNVGARIELTDFTDDEASVLEAGLCARAEGCVRPEAGQDDVHECAHRTLGAILQWTGGHPYLTQRLCKAVASRKDGCGPDAVGPTCAETFFEGAAAENDDNLTYVRDRMLRHQHDVTGALVLYDRLLRGQSIEDDPQDGLIGVLKLAGIAVAVAQHGRRRGMLTVRNRIYRRVFDRRWVRSSMPGADLARIRSAYRRGVWRTTAIAGAFALVLIVWAVTSAVLARIADRHREQSDRRRVAIEKLAGDLSQVARERQRALLGMRDAVSRERSLRRKADTATERALSAARLAEERRSEARRQLIRLVVASGADALSHGDDCRALLWFTRAIELESGDREREALDRLRVGTILAHGPRLVGCWQGVVGVSSDRRLGRIVTAGTRGEARVWDAHTGAPVGGPIRHGGRLTHAVLSPDGSRVATFGQRHLRIWNLSRTAMPVHRVGLPSDVADAVWLQDSAHIVAYTLDGRVRCWNAETGTETGPGAEAFPAQGIVRTGVTGNMVGFSCQSGEACVVDAKSGERRLVTPVIGEIADLAISPDGLYLAVASKNFYNAPGGNAGVTIWRIRDQTCVSGLLPHEGGARSVAFDPSGRLIASTGADRRVQVWEVPTGRPRGPALDLGSPGRRVAFDPSAKLLITAAESTGVRVWDATSREPRSPCLNTERGAVQALLSPDGRRLLVQDYDQTAWVWELDRPTRQDILGGSSTGCMTLDGRWAAASADGITRLVSPDSRRSLTLTHRGALSDTAFSRDGRFLAGGAYDGTAYVWQVPSGRVVRRWRMTGEAKHVRLSGDNSLALIRTETAVQMRSVGSGAAIRVFHASDTPFADAVLSPDGRTIATVTVGGRIRCHNPVSGALLGEFRGPRDPASLEFSPDGSRLLAAGSDGRVVLLGSRTARPAGPTLIHAHPVRHACWSPSGDAVAVAIGDQDASGPRTAHLWHARSGSPMIPPMVHRGAVRHVSFSPDGSLVITGGADRSVRVWSARTGEPVTQSLTMGGQVYYTQMARGNRKLLGASNDGTVRVWTLMHTSDHPEPLMRLAELMSCSRIDAVGGVTRLPRASVAELAARLHVLQPRFDGTVR